MIEAATYAVTIAMFSFVIVATARMSHELLLLVCIPPVFVALVMGFVMGIYAWDRFGLGLIVGAVAVPVPLAWRLSGRYTSRDLLICIYLAWAVGMVFALMAFSFPDLDEVGLIPPWA